MLVSHCSSSGSTGNQDFIYLISLSSLFLMKEKLDIWIKLVILPKTSADIQSFLYLIKKKLKAKP